jgi:hypothetical protein
MDITVPLKTLVWNLMTIWSHSSLLQKEHVSCLKITNQGSCVQSLCYGLVNMHQCILYQWETGKGTCQWHTWMPHSSHGLLLNKVLLLFSQWVSQSSVRRHIGKATKYIAKWKRLQSVSLEVILQCVVQVAVWSIFSVLKSLPLLCLPLKPLPLLHSVILTVSPEETSSIPMALKTSGHQIYVVYTSPLCSTVT